MAQVALVVMEPGGEWPTFMRGALEVVALTRTVHPMDVLRSACERADRLGRIIRVAAIACNRDSDTEAMRRRALAAGTVLKSVVRNGRGQLVLTAAGGAPLRLRQELVGLATSLNATLLGSTASVSVRVGRHVLAPPKVAGEVGWTSRAGSLLATAQATARRLLS